MASESRLVPIRRHAIIWIKDGLVCTRMYASLGLNELNHYLSLRIATLLHHTD